MPDSCDNYAHQCHETMVYFGQILSTRPLTVNESLAYLHVCNFVAVYSEMMTKFVQVAVDKQRTAEDANANQNDGGTTSDGLEEHGTVSRKTGIRANLPPIDPEATTGGDEPDKSG